MWSSNLIWHLTHTTVKICKLQKSIMELWRENSQIYWTNCLKWRQASCFICDRDILLTPNLKLHSDILVFIPWGWYQSSHRNKTTTRPRWSLLSCRASLCLVQVLSFRGTLPTCRFLLPSSSHMLCPDSVSLLNRSDPYGSRTEQKYLQGSKIRACKVFWFSHSYFSPGITDQRTIQWWNDMYKKNQQ